MYDNFEDIDVNKLSNKFVIKCNHGKGNNIIIKDKSKLNLETKKRINIWMKEK